MSANTGIEWTDHSWNPLVAYDAETGKRGWFCSHVSPGCVNCYAETINRRLGTGHDYKAQNARQVRVEVHEPTLGQPLRWRKPKRVFVCSMTDLFHAEHTDAQIDQVFAVMARSQRHQFQVLTKRPDRMREYCNARLLGLPLPNVWLGTSVESQRYADERIPGLCETPAAVRFLSCEPLLGPLDLRLWLLRVDWVIIGGESGPDARPFNASWARSIIAQCRPLRAAPFVKQLGRRPYLCAGGHDCPPACNCGRVHDCGGASGYCSLTVRDAKGGDMSEWPADLRVREFPAAVPYVGVEG